MDVYKTEEEQLETVKKWFKDNSSSILLVIVILAGFFGGRSYWQNYQQGHHEKAYVAFEAVSQLRDAALAEGADEDAFSTYVAGVDELKVDKPDHALTDLAVLKVAADFADNQQWDEAENELRWLRDQEAEPALQALVSYRLAQVLFQKEQYDDSIAIITEATAQGDDYLPRLQELLGDIYMEQEKLSQALKAYKAAAVSNSEKAVTSPALQWKIDDLAGVGA